MSTSRCELSEAQTRGLFLQGPRKSRHVEACRVVSGHLCRELCHQGGPLWYVLCSTAYIRCWRCHVGAFSRARCASPKRRATRCLADRASASTRQGFVGPMLGQGRTWSAWVQHGPPFRPLSFEEQEAFSLASCAVSASVKEVSHVGSAWFSGETLLGSSFLGSV